MLQIVKQPNGKYAIWSTGLDDFVYLDGTVDEIALWFGRKAKIAVMNEVKETIKELDEGGRPYFQFTKTWEELNEILHSNRS